MICMAAALVFVASSVAVSSAQYTADPLAYQAPLAYAAPRADADYDEPPLYKFEYSVTDDYSSSHFNQEEQRDNELTAGSYSVLLPDGRTQLVSYSVNGPGGYVAEVSYQGVASYPVEQTKYAAPAPRALGYASAPTYTQL